METRRTTAIVLCLIMLLSGCLNQSENVEVPDVVLPDDWATITARTVAAPQLHAYEDCEELEASLKRSIEEESRVSLLQSVADQYPYFGSPLIGVPEMAAEDGAVADTNSGAQPRTPVREEGVDFSGTNNQERGVDEADFLKTDGYHVYYLQGQQLHILAIPEFGQIELVSSTMLSGTPVAMMLDGDQLVVVSILSPWAVEPDHPLADVMNWGGDGWSWRTSSLTKFTVVDVSNRSEPDVQRELFIEGAYISAREVNGTVRTVTHASMNIPDVKTWLDLPAGYWNLNYDDPLRLEIREKVAFQTMMENAESINALELSDLIPQVYEYSDGEVSVHTMSDNDCAEFVAPESSLNRGISSIFTLGLTASALEYDVDHIVGNHPLVYASSDLLVLAETAFDAWWFWNNDGVDEMTNLHTFDISAPDATLYTGSGRVDGTVLNQFALSEHEGVLRVATTTGQWMRWWMDDAEPMSSQLVTLVPSTDAETGHQVLVEAGRVDGLAPGERIWSVRYDADRAYIVTFEQIDPLWVIDVSNASNPTVLGELKVPGVSTYIHPLSRDHLLTIGLGPANADGTGLDWSATQLSLFDIEDPTDPTQSATLRLSPVESEQRDAWSWSWSEASYESKAFQYWAPKSMLAVPLSTYRYVETSENGYVRWSYEYVSKLMLVEIDVANESLNEYGEINHSSFYNEADASGWWDDRNIRRSIFMGDFIYAVSAAGVSVTNLSTLEESDRVVLPSGERYAEAERERLETGDGDDREVDREDERSEGEDRSDAEGSHSEEDDDREREQSDDENRSDDERSGEDQPNDSRTR